MDKVAITQPITVQYSTSMQIFYNNSNEVKSTKIDGPTLLFTIPSGNEPRCTILYVILYYQPGNKEICPFLIIVMTTEEKYSTLPEAASPF